MDRPGLIRSAILQSCWDAGPRPINGIPKSRGVGTKSKASLSWPHNLAYVENWTFCDATGVNTVMQQLVTVRS